VLFRSNKVCLCARSPLTGIWGESRAGGFFGAELAKAGLSGVLFRGQAPEPAYLWIKDGQAELRPAKDLWGKDTIETSDAIRAVTDPKAQVGAIGPAGERLVRFACVMFGGAEARAAGRTGMGAVMGSKRLKAVAVRGTRPVAVHDREGLLAEMREVNRQARDDAGRLREFGTAGGVPFVEAAGDLPIQNWRLGSWEEGAKRIAPQTLFPRLLKRHYACFACPIRCGKVYRVPDGPHAGLEGHAPEYETVAGFGALCLNDDPDSIVKANDLCNRYGLDTISTSAAIAFAMEAFERGLITEADLAGGLPHPRPPSPRVERGLEGEAARRDATSPPLSPSPQAERGLGGEDACGAESHASHLSHSSHGSHSSVPAPTWGNSEAVLALIEQIAHREGIGRLLGEGVRRAAEALGGDAASFAIHTKGLEYAFHDPRAFISMAPSYATGSRGSCHMESFSYILGYGSPMPDLGYERGSVEPQDHEGAARIAVLMQNLMTVYDALGLCKFLSRGGVGPSHIAKWINLVTGWDLSASDVMLAGERLFNLKRLYNLRCGVRREDDALPHRLEHLDRSAGAAAGSLPDMPRLMKEYYALRDWDARGFPTPARLRRLGLDDLARHLGVL
jgi:aldehyde:ferredoxin oxidoreductase